MNDDEAAEQARLTELTGLTPDARTAVEELTAVLMVCTEDDRERILGSYFRDYPTGAHVVRTLIKCLGALFTGRADPAGTHQALTMRAEMVLMMRAVENGQPIPTTPRRDT